MIRLLTLSYLLCIPCFSQTITGPATTDAPCTASNTGNGNTFTINCGIGKEQGQKMLEILNKILTNQLSPKAVMDKLDEIEKAVQRISTPLPKRRIQGEDRAGIIALLSEKTGTVGVSAIANDREAYQFAQDWYDVLKAAGWKMQDEIVRVFIVSGMPSTGITMKFHGQPVEAGTRVSINTNSLEGHVAMALEKVKASWSVQRFL
jgi:hypothetical protein